MFLLPTSCLNRLHFSRSDGDIPPGLATDHRPLAEPKGAVQLHAEADLQHGGRLPRDAEARGQRHRPGGLQGEGRHPDSLRQYDRDAARRRLQVGDKRQLVQRQHAQTRKADGRGDPKVRDSAWSHFRTLRITTQRSEYDCV